jgi:hypothetical protein
VDPLDDGVAVALAVASTDNMMGRTEAAIRALCNMGTSVE